jgi:hypothetical protein
VKSIAAQISSPKLSGYWKDKYILYVMHKEKNHIQFGFNYEQSLIMYFLFIFRLKSICFNFSSDEYKMVNDMGIGKKN